MLPYGREKKKEKSVMSLDSYVTRYLDDNVTRQRDIMTLTVTYNSSHIYIYLIIRRRRGVFKKQVICQAAYIFENIFFLFYSLFFTLSLSLSTATGRGHSGANVGQMWGKIFEIKNIYYKN